LEEGVLREQVTSDTATGGGQYDIINIGMQEAPIWGAAGWIEPLNFGAEYDVDDMLPAMRNGLSHEGTLYAAPFYGESSMVMYRKDLTDAAGVTVRDNDSWANIKGTLVTQLVRTGCGHGQWLFQLVPRTQKKHRHSFFPNDNSRSDGNHISWPIEPFPDCCKRQLFFCCLCGCLSRSA